jgi:hypothetical protein
MRFVVIKTNTTTVEANSASHALEVSNEEGTTWLNVEVEISPAQDQQRVQETGEWPPENSPG